MLDFDIQSELHRDEFTYDLWLRNDLYTNKHTQWFYFRVGNTRANVQYRFTIVNLIKVRDSAEPSGAGVFGVGGRQRRLLWHDDSETKIAPNSMVG